MLNNNYKSWERLLILSGHELTWGCTKLNNTFVQPKSLTSQVDKFKQSIVNKGFDLIDRPANAVRVAMKESIKNKDTHGFGSKIDVLGALKQGITGEKRADVKEAFLTPKQIKSIKYNNPVLDFISEAVVGGAIDPLTYLTGGTAGSIVASVLKRIGLSAKLLKGAATIADIAQATGKTEKELHAIVASERAVQIEKANQALSNATPVVKSTTSLPAGIGKSTPILPKTIVGEIGRQTPIKNEFKVVQDTLKQESNIINQPEITQAQKTIIPEGQKERGFSANTRTDTNNPDSLRDSFTEKPLSYEQIHGTDTIAKAQEIFDKGYEHARTQVSYLSAKMQPEAVPLAKMLARKATESGNIQGAREILSDVAEKLTQAGQFSQAARLLREANPETFLMTIGKQLKKLNKEGLETYGKKWNDMDLTPDELDLISKIKSGDQQAYEDAFEKIGARIANEMPSSASEKINAWRHMAMLLNPKTHIRNVTGNAIMLGMRKVSQRVSGVGQKVLLKEGDRTQSILVKKEYKKIANDYFESNRKDLLSGANKYNEGIRLNMPNKRVFKNNVVEKVRKFNYDLLQWGDNPFYKNAYVDRLASYAQTKGVKDFSKLGQEAFDIAKLEAEQATYKDASIIASFLNKLKNPQSKTLGSKVGSVVVDAALPFTKTRINIIKRGIQYSPWGIVSNLSKIKSAAGIDELAKGLTGTGILGLGYLLASKGILTGKAENDPDLREYNKNTGNSPFSVLGKYSYDWAQPFAVPFSVGVEIYNAVKDKPEDMKKLDALIQNNDTNKMEEMIKKISAGIMDSFNASGDTVFNMSILKGVRTLLGSGTKGAMEGLAQLPQSYASQFIPTALNQVARMIDPTVRQTYYKGNMPESVKASLVSKIPIASKRLEPKQTPWGEDVKRNENPFIRAFSQFLSPGIISEPQNINPEVDTELRRLNTVGEKIQFPTVAATSFTWKGQKFDLSPSEYSDFQRTLGQNTLAAYTDYIKTPEYNALTDSEKAKELSGLISDAKNLAKFQLIQNKGLANSKEIMSVSESFTNNKVTKKLTFEQQNELAENIAKYKMAYKKNKFITEERAEKLARDRANAEMKRKLFSK